MLRLYRVREDYINYLQQYDCNVKDNKGQRRPYIGVALTIDQTEFFVPLTSPKPKHANMKDRVDFLRLRTKDRILAAITFNNMIPVYSDVVSPIDIANEPDRKYQILLYKQTRWIRNHQDDILSHARRTYDILTHDTTQSPLTPFQQRVKGRSCDITLLEQKMYDFQELQRENAPEDAADC